jgi:hypothetical protein
MRLSGSPATRVPQTYFEISNEVDQRVAQRSRLLCLNFPLYLLFATILLLMQNRLSHRLYRGVNRRRERYVQAFRLPGSQTEGPRFLYSSIRAEIPSRKERLQSSSFPFSTLLPPALSWRPRDPAAPFARSARKAVADVTDKAKERAIAIGIAISSGYMFGTTFEKDLLGPLWRVRCNEYTSHDGTDTDLHFFIS